jgi:hypothetical protein
VKIRCRLRAWLGVEPEAAFDFTNRAENFRSFTGFGPIPGIREASYVTPGEPRLGSLRRIVKTDGTEHSEEITVFEPPARHTSRIRGLGPPFSWLVREGEDDWVFTPERGGTRVDRTFVFTLTSPLAAPVAQLVLHTLMRAAIRRDLANIQRAVIGRSSTPV